MDLTSHQGDRKDAADRGKISEEREQENEALERAFKRSIVNEVQVHTLVTFNEENKTWVPAIIRAP